MNGKKKKCKTKIIFEPACGYVNARLCDNMEIDRRIATIFDAVEEAYVCVDAAMRFADYLMEDRDEENRLKLEVALPDAKVWIDSAMKNVERLKNELKA